MDGLLGTVWPKKWSPDPEPAFVQEEVVREEAKFCGHFNSDCIAAFVVKDIRHQKSLAIHFDGDSIWLKESAL